MRHIPRTTDTRLSPLVDLPHGGTARPSARRGRGFPRFASVDGGLGARRGGSGALRPPIRVRARREESHSGSSEWRSAHHQGEEDRFGCRETIEDSRTPSRRYVHDPRGPKPAKDGQTGTDAGHPNRMSLNLRQAPEDAAKEDSPEEKEESNPSKEGTEDEEQPHDRKCRPQPSNPRRHLKPLRHGQSSSVRVFGIIQFHAVEPPQVQRGLRSVASEGFRETRPA